MIEKINSILLKRKTHKGNCKQNPKCLWITHST